MGQREREFHYAAYDLIACYIDAADEKFLIEYMQDLLITKPWWDTVDGMGTAGVSPLCQRYDAREIVWQWSRSPNQWLNRAAIQHQRGWKRDTDVEFILELCDVHAASREYFVARPSVGRCATSLDWMHPRCDVSCVNTRTSARLRFARPDVASRRPNRYASRTRRHSQRPRQPVHLPEKTPAGMARNLISLLISATRRNPSFSARERWQGSSCPFESR